MGGRGGTREEKWHLFIYFIGNLKYANFKVNIVIHGREGTQCSSVIWGILWWYYALIRRCTLTSLLSINGQVDGFLRSLFLFLKYLTTKDAYVFFFVCVKAYLAWLEAFLLICTEWEHNTDCIYHKKCCETTKWTPHVFTDGKIQRSEEDKLYYKLDNGKQESKFETGAIPFLRAASRLSTAHQARRPFSATGHRRERLRHCFPGNTPRANTRKDLELSSAGPLLHFV